MRRRTRHVLSLATALASERVLRQIRVAWAPWILQVVGCKRGTPPHTTPPLTPTPLPPPCTPILHPRYERKLQAINTHYGMDASYTHVIQGLLGSDVSLFGDIGGDSSGEDSDAHSSHNPVTGRQGGRHMI